MSLLIESSVILCLNNVKLVGCGMGMGFAQTWLRQVSLPATVREKVCNNSKKRKKSCFLDFEKKR